MVARGLTLIALVMLAGCTPGTLCGVGPFQPDPGSETRWTRAEKEQAYVWNRTGEDVCGWKAPRRGS